MSDAPIAGRSFPQCDTCVNREYDPFECKRCVEGSHWQRDDDDVDWLTMHEFKGVLEKEAGEQDE
jgi:hypothetical protein